MSLCVHFEMCSTFQKHLFEGDFVPQGRFYFTSIATTHPWVAHICIILINVNIGHWSLAFGPGSACSRQHEKKPLWVGGRAKVYGTQWQPVCRRSSHFPRRISCLLVSHCIDFHAWNSPILKDNVIGALGVKKSAVFSERRRQGWGEGDCGGRRGSPVGYSKTPDTPPQKKHRALVFSGFSPARQSPPHSLSQAALPLCSLSARWLEALWRVGISHERPPWQGLTFQAPVGRKMNGAGDSGRGSSFSLHYFTSRSRWGCVTVCYPVQLQEVTTWPQPPPPPLPSDQRLRVKVGRVWDFFFFQVTLAQSSWRPWWQGSH